MSDEPLIERRRAPAGPEYLRWAMPLLASLLLASLALNLVTIFTLLRARAIARDAIGNLAAQIEDASDDVLQLEVPIKQSVPINVTVPLRQQFTVPISTTVPFDDVIPLPVLGTTINIPIQTQFRIRTEVPVDIDTTVPINTSINVDLTVPLNVPVRETPLAAYLERLRQSLLDMRESL